MIPADIDNFRIKIISTYFIQGNGKTVRVEGSFVKIPREISNCSSLVMIHLSDLKIEDISALSNCKKITILHLHNNKIVDISALSKCSSLTMLNLRNNKIVDITPLLKCEALDDLYVENNNIQSKLNFNRRINVRY